MKRLSDRIVMFLLNRSILMVLIAIVGIMSVASDKFFSLPNFLNILNNYAITAIVSCGVAVVVFAGGIDLSFGSIISCCAILATFFSSRSIWIPVSLTIFLGAFLGFADGVLVAKIGINPLIATLGTQGLFYSALLIVTSSHFVLGSDKSLFHQIGHGNIAGIPFPIYLLLGVFLASLFVLRYTLFGKYVYAHGSQKTALFCAGVNSSNILMSSYIFMGVLVAIGSILVSSRLIGVLPMEGSRYFLVVLTAVILSGVSLSGGSGSLANVLIAVMVLGVLDHVMVLLAIEYRNQQMIRGCIFILAVAYNNLMLKAKDAFLKRAYSRILG
jgi:ribose/xylose/arabinose/galactoside ABC-type transport system permease subunit